ncbi:hypothetical protein HDE_08928 [Halotydeus destructor]|nr:hypothetical protein HDE_08928 [Halotydeus destructor]
MIISHYSHVRLSSFLILVGVGSYVAYKYITNQKRKLKRRATFQRTSESRYYDYYEEPSEANSEDDDFPSPINRIWNNKRRRGRRSSSTPFNRTHRDTNYSNTDNESDIMNNAEYSQAVSNLTRSYSIVSSNNSEFGDATVAKLDALIYQLDDIKTSVVEMDADLYNVNQVISKPTTNFLKLAAISLEDESYNELQTTEASDADNHSPSLEWDCNDVVAQNLSFSQDEHLPKLRQLKTISELNLTQTAPDVPKLTARLRQQPSLFYSPPTTLPLDSASEASSSGKGSLASSPGMSKDRKLQDLIEEARKLGLVNDLLEALLKNNKRDSAYFED